MYVYISFNYCTPIDGGHYLFTTAERDEFLQREPGAAPYFRRWLGSDEFLNGYERWCLWLGNCPSEVLREMPEVHKRVEAVRRYRSTSKSAPTRKLAEQPTRFHVENMPDSDFLVILKVSSERRDYIPLGFMTPETLCSDLVFIVPNATLYHFGVLSSAMHMAWMRKICGRLKSDYRYSAGIVYNNFPWPALSSPSGRGAEGEGGTTVNPSPQPLSQRERGLITAIETAAQAVLDARREHPNTSLAP